MSEISFSYERISIKTHFENNDKGNSEMAYLMYCVGQDTVLSSYLSSPTSRSGSWKTDRGENAGVNCDEIVSNPETICHFRNIG